MSSYTKIEQARIQGKRGVSHSWVVFQHPKWFKLMVVASSSVVVCAPTPNHNEEGLADLLVGAKCILETLMETSKASQSTFYGTLGVVGVFAKTVQKWPESPTAPAIKPVRDSSSGHVRNMKWVFLIIGDLCFFLLRVNATYYINMSSHKKECKIVGINLTDKT